MTHPSPAFSWTEEATLQAFVATKAFATIAIAVDGQAMTAHAPLTVYPDGAISFHLARANPLTRRLDASDALVTVVGEDGYISPDWYGTEDQVPTWNYRLVEIAGRVRRLDEADLANQIDRLSTTHERMLAPKKPWHLDKLSPPRREALFRAIVGFSIDAPAWRGIAKLGQNKSAFERSGVVAALQDCAKTDLAALMSRL